MYRLAYEKIYGKHEYVEGTDPTPVAREGVEHVTAEGSGVAIDLGSGEGRDAVFFAERGFDAVAVDTSPNGLAKTERLADERGVSVETRQADLNELRVDETLHLAHSVGATQYVRPENREALFESLKATTASGGVHSLTAFVDKPDRSPPPVWEDYEHFFEVGELRGYYDDWEVVHCEERTLNEMYVRETTHPNEWVVARKP